MAGYDVQYDKERRVSGRLEFIGGDTGEVPAVEIAMIAPDGERQPLELSPEGAFTLDAEHAGKNFALEIGPEGADTRTYRFDDVLRTVGKSGVQRIAEPTWRKWRIFSTCVTGRVRVCRPRIFHDHVLDGLGLAVKQRASLTLGSAIASPHFPTRCYPVCQGKVEVFVRTCCCPIILDPPIIIRNICEIIDCSRVETPVEIGPVGPGPVERLGDILQTRTQVHAYSHAAADEVIDSVGLPVFDADDAKPLPTTSILPSLEPSVTRAIKRSRATEGGPDAEEIVVLARHLSALLTLEPAHQIEYLDLYPDLRHRFCSCSTHKVAEVPLQSDGHFDACFDLGLYLRLGCSRRVQYRVSQLQGTSWVVVYDGLARGESYALGEDAMLSADPAAQTCGERHWPEGKPFATLEHIGSTSAHRLIHATNQNGETSYAGPLAARDGLVDPAPATYEITDGPFERPWGQSLALFYGFHPGLHDVGAKYFRTRVVRLDANGNQDSEFTIVDPIWWNKYYEKPDGQPGVHAVLLNDSGPGVEGLCLIPFPDAVWPWLGQQPHVVVDTAKIVGVLPVMPDGKYTFVLDLFDAAGHRLLPDTSADLAVAGEVGPVAFDFRRLTGPNSGSPTDTALVAHKALATLFHVDNLWSLGDIEQIVYGLPSAVDCQFLAGPGSDKMAVRYTASHGHGYQWYHEVVITRGLSAAQVMDYKSSANVTNGDTPPISFAALLGGEERCAFAATLKVYTRHTNGSGQIVAYDASDIAAFAVQNTTPAGP